MIFDSFARVELESFFRRREEQGRFYCRACLATQLTQRGARKVAAIAWTTAVEDVFVRPGLLQMRCGKPCDVCKEPGLSIGAKLNSGGLVIRRRWSFDSVS